MKSIILTFAAIFVMGVSLYGQAPPQGFKYQAIAYDNNGRAINNRTVSFRFSILQGSDSAASVYTETHSVLTNRNGLVSIVIGTGTVESGIFDSINWGTDTYFLRVEMDRLGGTAYLLMGVSQLQSVPYALFAASSGSITPGPPGPAGPAGLKGDQGEKGEKGDAGGAPGPKGDKGDPGSDGAKGEKGDPGMDGADGAKGDPGAKGDKGDPGLDGAPGPKGDKGEQGDPGLDGAKGEQGEKGEKGDKGEKGSGGAGSFAALMPLEIVDDTVIQIKMTYDADTSTSDGDTVLFKNGSLISFDGNNWVIKERLISSFHTDSTFSNMQPYLGLNYCIAVVGVYPIRNMSAFSLLGSVGIFAGDFAPAGWALCDGQLLAINANPVLFTILGTTYGGDGVTTFALPDLRGRVILGPRTGPGLSPRTLGEVGGTENGSINFDHTHTLEP